MKVGFTYEADKEASMGFTVLPAGNYKVRITELKYEPTSDKLGTNFNFTFTVMEGEYQNEKVFDQIAWTWDDDHQKAVRFGRTKFSCIMKAIGKSHFDGDTDEFLGGELLINVGIREYESNGAKKQSNQIKDYINTSSSTGSVMSPSVASGVARPAFGNPAVSNPFGKR